MREIKNSKTRVWSVLLLGLTLVGFFWTQPSQARCECEKRMEAKLEKDFSFYTDSETVMEFNFGVAKKDDRIEVQLYGQNFDGDDPEWKQRVVPAFEEYIGAMGSTVSYEMQRPMVRMHVIGDDGAEITVFRFD
ncbi:MAG: hypothetical protein H6751_04210 [Candidatus Omnitrophica bacterium]|nr:hypothetical protein [Candidatus Omnitrophota bacterium]